MKGIRKDLGTFMTKTEMSKRQLSAILGQVRANLLALPFLRAFTGNLVEFFARKSEDPWDSKHPITQDIKDELQKVRKIFDAWSGRPFPSKPTTVLHSDSSDLGWGGLDPNSGEKVQEYWRDRKDLHINVKEMEAAINTVCSLAKKNETVELNVDNQVIYYYLAKGGGRRTPSTNCSNPSGNG